MKRILLAVISLVCLVACPKGAKLPPDSGQPDGGIPADAGSLDGGPVDGGLRCDWTQWGGNALHSGNACVAGQSLNRALATFTFDPFVPLEQAENNGDLSAHFQSPLIAGGDVYMVLKGGTYVSCQSLVDSNGNTYRGLSDGGLCGNAGWGSLSWSEAHLQWGDGGLTQTWAYASDWKPQHVLSSWEPVFHPVIAGGYLYLPGFGGTIHKVDRFTGRRVTVINPLPAADGGSALDSNTFVSGPLTADTSGNILYNVVRTSAVDPFYGDASGWLVRVAPNDSVQMASYASLVTSAPASDAGCYGVFRSPAFHVPYPPADDGGVRVLPPIIPCLSQRPGVNVAPAVGPDGVIYTVSRAQGEGRYSYMVAINPDLTPKWSTSFRDLLNDACGVVVPADLDDTGHTPDGGVARSHCRATASLGVDKNTNQKPAGMVTDDSSSSPVVLPDGVMYGAYTAYNNYRGHLFKFNSSGQPVANYDFGWDVTPGFFVNNGTYSIITKDNHYYNYQDFSDGPYYITHLSSLLAKTASFTATNTQSCVRQSDGGINCAPQVCDPATNFHCVCDVNGLNCVEGHPNGFEWCVNAPAIDSNGVTYVNSEDGNVYAINPDNSLKGQYFLFEALGAAYTPIALDAQGRVYSLNGGQMTVVGQ